MALYALSLLLFYVSKQRVAKICAGFAVCGKNLGRGERLFRHFRYTGRKTGRRRRWRRRQNNENIEFSLSATMEKISQLLLRRQNSYAVQAKNIGQRKCKITYFSVLFHFIENKCSSLIRKTFLTIFFFFCNNSPEKWSEKTLLLCQFFLGLGH